MFVNCVLVYRGFLVHLLSFSTSHPISLPPFYSTSYYSSLHSLPHNFSPINFAPLLSFSQLLSIPHLRSPLPILILSSTFYLTSHTFRLLSSPFITSLPLFSAPQYPHHSPSSVFPCRLSTVILITFRHHQVPKIITPHIQTSYHSLC